MTFAERGAVSRRRRIVLLAVGLVSTAVPLRAGAQAAPVVEARPAEARELVVLVHGLGRTPLSMLPLEWALEREGYEVLNWGYSSYRHSIPELGRRLADDLEARGGPPPGRLHFVGHSLGNIIVRWVLAHDRPDSVGRVVMLAPPNRGARVADRWAPWLGWLLVPLPELVTGEGGAALTIPPPEGVEVGVIAGRYDGKVTVEETRLAGAAGHLTVPAAHTFIMARGDVRRLVAGFLREGPAHAAWSGAVEGTPGER